MVQLPALLRATLAEETPPVPFDTGSTDWLPATMEQDPVALTALKFTCNPFATPFDSAVA